MVVIRFIAHALLWGGLAASSVGAFYVGPYFMACRDGFTQARWFPISCMLALIALMMVIGLLLFESFLKSGRVSEQA